MKNSEGCHNECIHLRFEKVHREVDFESWNPEELAFRWLSRCVSWAAVLSPFQRWASTKSLDLTPPSVDAATVVRVWVYKKTELYFCSDSTFYGKLKPRCYMVQEKALQTGYQPALHKLCK